MVSRYSRSSVGPGAARKALSASVNRLASPAERFFLPAEYPSAF